MMNFSLFLLICAITLIGTISGNLVYGQEENNNSVFDIIQVTDSIYMLSGGGGNVGVSVGDDGIFLIDDKVNVLSDKLLNTIKEISDKPVKFIINTHWHPDHVGGNEELAKTDSIIISHGNTRERLSTEQFSSFFNKTVDPLPDGGLPIITFSNEITFYFNNDVINIKHIPNAHTDGDVIIYFNNSNVMHIGDIVSDTYFPYIDLSAGGSIDGIIKGIENTILPLANEETKIIVGHGGLSTKDHIISSLNMMKDIKNMISDAILQNKTLDQIHEMKPTEKHNEQYGDGFINATQFTELVYKSLKSQQ
ncbi:MAG: MBL fold metallo-hydrolase [Nitrososphaeraceae archaeon]